MAAAGIDALVISVGSDLPYLTGYTAVANERLTMAVVRDDVVDGSTGITAGGLACIADFSTASSPIDLANRVLSSATEAVGSTWRDYFMYLANKMGLRLTVGMDPRTQTPTASLDLGLR